ncbi:MAG TPA: hypothetical protein VJ767_00705 [Nitrososphaeraceae archaeon]|nr:hypothetical protein [Nitrososphaeraceae archaeon]
MGISNFILTIIQLDRQINGIQAYEGQKVQLRDVSYSQDKIELPDKESNKYIQSNNDI